MGRLFVVEITGVREERGLTALIVLKEFDEDIFVSTPEDLVIFRAFEQVGLLVLEAVGGVLGSLLKEHGHGVVLKPVVLIHTAELLKAFALSFCHEGRSQH